MTAPASRSELTQEPEEPRTGIPFPIVGVGASAGGLEAFTQFMKALPPDTGMAFVLVQHLAPSHESALAEILSRATEMSVKEVADGLLVERDCVYVIPPDHNMLIEDGRLRLLPRAQRGAHHPIDAFFQSLAEQQRSLAIGVILSGTATDGTLGLEAIKAQGGITFAQDDTAQHAGMPQSAAASGCVDFVLPPEGIAAELARLSDHPFLAWRDAASAPAAGGDPPHDKQALAQILQILRASTAVDFRHYKSNTLTRRIGRRMVLLRKATLDEYVAHLRGDPAEVQALYQDILINVTSFFREPSVFEAIQGKVLPALLQNRSEDEPLRMWVVGCSTGEEAYSLAMVASEAMEDRPGHAMPKIFATDLNPASIARARAGVYPAESLHTVSPARRRRFFVENDGSFRVTKPLRDMCVFSQHNVAADPPYSRMDLVSCRNLLIYLEPSLQRQVLPVLHYALVPDGFLVLGASETVVAFPELFIASDARNKIFARLPGPGRLPRPTPLPEPPPATPGVAAARSAAAEPVRKHVQQASDHVLLAYAPPAVLVDPHLNILQFRGNTEPYLVPAQGRATHSLLMMAREGLLGPLRALVQRGRDEGGIVRARGVRVSGKDGVHEVDLEVVPIEGTTPQERCQLVLFRPPARASATRTLSRKRRSGRGTRAPLDVEDGQLAHELAVSRAYAQELASQHAATMEALQTANESLQSANEEFQSLNEELETSKEEIQSSNEELATLNDELQHRNHELGQLNSDLTNLISSVQVAIVFVGCDMRIRRFSPMAQQLLNIIPADVGRPITDIRVNLALPQLEEALTTTLENASSADVELQMNGGRWYSLRIRPYVTLEEDKVDGAVLMFVDIDVIHRAREYAENVIAAVSDPMLVLDANLRVRTANRSFYDTFALSPETILGRPFQELGEGQWDIPELRGALEQVLPGDKPLQDFVVERDFAQVGRKILRLRAKGLLLVGDERDSILLTIEDITDISRLREGLERSERRFRRLFETATDGLLLIDPATRRIIDANPYITALLGFPTSELLGSHLLDLVLPQDEERARALFNRLLQDGVMRCADVPLRSRLGERQEVEMVGSLHQEGDSRVIQLHIRDISERKLVEAALQASEERSTALFELGPVALLSCDAGGVLQQYSRQAAKLWGREPARGDPAERYCGSVALRRPDGSPWPHMESPIVQVLRTGEILRDVEMLVERPDGSCVPIVAAFAPLKDGEGVIVGAVAAYFDNSEHRRLETELEQRIVELALADKSKSTFLAMLSHELRTPLNAIRGWIHLLQRPGVTPETLHKGLDVIDRQSRAQTDLIADLMDVQRLTTGKISLASMQVDLTGVLEAAVEAVLPQAEAKGLRIRCEIEPGDCVITGDPIRLQQILWNLLSNATKFTPPDGGIVVTLRRAGAQAEICVSDTGVGFDPHLAPLLFEQFRQADPSTSRSHGGLGLGLAIVRRLVELHGGQVRGESQGKGQGARFVVELPLLRAPEIALKPDPAESVSEGSALRGTLVLVVDDEVDAREALRRALEEAGAEVITASSTSEAAALLPVRRPDILLSDIGMPGRDGYELLRSIRALPPDQGGRIPAIALTSYSSAEKQASSLEAGFDIHLIKPVELSQLVTAAAGLVTEHRGRQGSWGTPAGG